MEVRAYSVDQPICGKSTVVDMELRDNMVKAKPHGFAVVLLAALLLHASCVLAQDPVDESISYNTPLRLVTV